MRVCACVHVRVRACVCVNVHVCMHTVQVSTSCTRAVDQQVCGV